MDQKNFRGCNVYVNSDSGSTVNATLSGVDNHALLLKVVYNQLAG